MNWLSKRLPWVLIAASASLFFLPLGTRALWNSDEGRYAEIAREMLVLRDWLSPHLNYVLYFEKPPFLYWLTALSLVVFGQNEFAARFWCGVFGVLTVGVTYLFGKQWKDEATGLFAGGILATSLLFFGMTQYLATDMALAFWLTLALYAASRVVVERAPEDVRRYTHILALAAAGGMLTKGLIGLLFPAAALFLTVAYGRLWGQLRKIPWKADLIAAAVIASPWFIAISLRHPSFPYFFLIREHLLRFVTTVHHRHQPFYFYLPVLLGGFLPWSVFIPKIISSAFELRGLAMKRDPTRALLIIWCVFITVFFSLAQSKLIGYLLPVLPALALLCGQIFREALDQPEMPKWMERGIVALVILHIVGLCVLKLPPMVRFFTGPAALAARTQGDVLSLLLGLLVFILVGIWGMRQSVVAFGGIMVAQVLLLTTLVHLSVVFDPFFSNRGLAHIVMQKGKPTDRIIGYSVGYDNNLQAMAFYAQRRIAVFSDPGELSMGEDETPGAQPWFSGSATMKDDLMKEPPGTWVVTDEPSQKDLTSADHADEFELAGREGRLYLLRKLI